MAACATCNRTILFGGVRVDEERFCNKSCQESGALSRASAAVAPAQVMAEAQRVRCGECPRCGDSGSPIEVRTSYRAISFVVMTRWSSHPALCCRRCHVKNVAGNALITLLAGWWGFPWGLIATPIQLLRNAGALLSSDQGNEPSPELQESVRLLLAGKALQLKS